MKLFSNRICLVMAALLWCGITVSAQMTLPAKAMGIPKIFLDEEESWDWVNVVANREWGETSNQFWRVYIDREGVKSYASPSASAQTVKTFHFMDKGDVLYVAQIQDGYALLYEEKYEQTDLNISPQAKALGWVSVDELLLWSTCPRTISQVYQKAVILKDVDAIQNNKDLNEASPEFSKSPAKAVSTGRRATDLEFYFVYKIVNGSALLMEDNKITATIASSKKGWMKQGLYTLWNDRLCFEPNFGSDVSGKEAAVFSEKTSARLFKSTGKPTDDLNPIWKEELTDQRWSAKKVRFPVIEMDKSYIATVGTISSFGSSKSPNSPKVDINAKEIDRITNQIDAIEAKLRKINVVFVMDGTSSMRNFYQPMAKALTQAMSQNEMQGANMYFGAVVYRNYDDEKDDRLVEKKQLTNDYKSVAEWLVARECHSIGASHYEAMYCGIETALDQMNWGPDNCNFLVLVGDAANAVPDEKGRTMDNLINKMAAKGVNFIVFQANHLDHSAYHDFSLQIQKMMFGELGQMVNKKITRADFKLENQLYTYKNSDKFIVVSAGFRFAEINKSESESNLRALVENKIVDFKRQAEDNLTRLRVALEGLGMDVEQADTPESTEFAQGAIDFLKEKGLTDEDIQILRERNTTLKIKGFATRVAGVTDVFTPCVFMAKPELDLLIQSLSAVNKDVSENPRKDLQDAIKDLALSYVGQGANSEDMEVDDVMNAVLGLTSVTGQSVLAGINIKDITNPAKVSESQINDFFEGIAKDVDRLKKKRTDKSCYFDSPNGLRYYYILFEDMPLQSY